MPLPSFRQRAMAALTSSLVASGLFLSVLFAFDPAILATLALPSSA